MVKPILLRELKPGQAGITTSSFGIDKDKLIVCPGPWYDSQSYQLIGDTNSYQPVWGAQLMVIPLPMGIKSIVEGLE